MDALRTALSLIVKSMVVSARWAGLSAVTLIVLLVASAVHAQVGNWNSSGAMSVERDCHTATLLPDGKVLIAGGRRDSQLPTTIAEICDPASGTFSPTAALQTARAYHTATLLGNGQVLVTGGYSDPQRGPTKICELYSAGRWRTTQEPMSQRRELHAATLLRDGRVLITGGLVTLRPDAFASAEIYDPQLDKFLPTGNMCHARFGHTSTLLPDGKVLILGGTGASGSLASAEIYDPALGQFQEIVGMIHDRYRHTAIALTDSPLCRILIAGGLSTRRGQGIQLASAETCEYDSRTGSIAFRLLASTMAEPRMDHTATRLKDGSVLIVGGMNGNLGGMSLKSAELYDPSTATFRCAGLMPTGRHEHTATLLPDGRILVAGGERYRAGMEQSKLADALLYSSSN